MRIELFGPEKAFLPLTLDQALQDDEAALNMGFMRVVPAKDPAGRGILFADPSRQDKSLYTRESMTRAMWYVIHALLEDEQVQKPGIVFIAYPRNAALHQADRAQMRLNIDSIKGCFLRESLSFTFVIHRRILRFYSR